MKSFEKNTSLKELCFAGTHLVSNLDGSVCSLFRRQIQNGQVAHLSSMSSVSLP
jgi:hypothetical protein